MKYLKFFERFREDQVPVKFHTDVEQMERDFLNGDYVLVIKSLDEMRENSNNIPEEDVYFRTSFPSQELEEKAGSSGISKKWKLPFGFDEQHLENLSGIFMDDEKITDIIFNELLSINTELNIFTDVPFKMADFYSKNSVIGGVCSRFNEGDIKDFIESRRSIKHVDGDNNFIFTDYDGLYTNLFNSVKNKVSDVGYFPSPDTLKSVMKWENVNLSKNRYPRLIYKKN